MSNDKLLWITFTIVFNLPIYLYRYVGDILAWLHQAVAGEKELLQSLLRRTNVKGKLLCSFFSP